jgi:catechol 2,3-dioxygenase-like lactoylglutathione lyase family enzyme
MEFHHTCILTGNRKLAAACERFYIDNFGMGVTFADVSETADYSFYADNVNPAVSPFEIIGKSFDEREKRFLTRCGPGLDHICFMVEDIEAVVETMSGNGVEFNVPPYRYENYLIAWCRDPSGVDVELLEADIDFPEATYQSTTPKAIFHHIAVLAGNPELARVTENFYRQHIGLEPVSGNTGRTTNGIYLEDSSVIQHPWIEITGIPVFQSENTFYMQKGSGIGHLCFGVANAEHYFDFLKEKRVVLASDIIAASATKMFYLYDPAGTCVQVLEMPGI